MSKTAAPASHNLVLTRVFDAPPEKVYRCWTDPALMKQWFVPKPWSLAKVDTDVRPGGSSLIVMRDPEGKEFPNHGVYLEVVPNRKLVFTDAYTKAWEPSAKPFMTATVTFEPDGNKTRYTATASHWTAEDMATHEKMGFHEGWSKCADQLAELLKTL